MCRVLDSCSLPSSSTIRGKKRLKRPDEGSSDRLAWLAPAGGAVERYDCDEKRRHRNTHTRVPDLKHGDGSAAGFLNPRLLQPPGRTCLLQADVVCSDLIKRNEMQTGASFPGSQPALPAEPAEDEPPGR